LRGGPAAAVLAALLGLAAGPAAADRRAVPQAGPGAADYQLGLQASPAAGENPGLVLWYDRPAEKWEGALPVGNGRLGAMVFGRAFDERIMLNEDTLWSGGPYSTVVPGGAEALPEIQRLIFAGEYRRAHTLFGRRLMGYPVEQMKYQPLADLALTFPAAGPVAGYRRRLDLDTAVASTRFEADGAVFRRDVLASPVDQVIAVRLTADRPGRISFKAQLRGFRNTAHSNYATDYFRMDGLGGDGLRLTGRSADYMGVEGRLRYEARLRALAEGGTVRVVDDELAVEGADAVTLLVAAATSFRSYKDVGGDPAARVEAQLRAAAAKPYPALLEDHVREHRRLFRRVDLRLPETEASAGPTDRRLRAFDGASDPALAALAYQFGRYLLISSSRPGTQPANLQGIWNKDSNPMWDAKYTTNINTQMNYWPAETGNLSECAEPLFRMIRELTDQGARVAREHYGARGWVHHQNTDLWRVAAPMDGPSWGAFTTGGAWLCTHLWEHYLFTGDRAFLAESYPVLRGAAEFFLDFLVPHPRYGWLVTNPSTSPENFPAGPAATRFFDEITTFMTGTSIAAGSTIDMQIIGELFAETVRASEILGLDPDLRRRLREARSRLAPLRVGHKGNLQEWLEDWDETEASHRHISGLWGLFPGRTIGPRRTPGLARAAAVVLDQRGLPGNGWSSAWKAACWARLENAPRAMENVATALRMYTTDSLFSTCSGALQVDGALGLSAALTELLLQSHQDEIALLPALPEAWTEGQARGLMARGGFEVGMIWAGGRLTRATIGSKLGGTCRIRAAGRWAVSGGGQPVRALEPGPGLIEFETAAGRTYVLTPR
jgi:alpha-L-fucosidase 2